MSMDCNKILYLCTKFHIIRRGARLKRSRRRVRPSWVHDPYPRGGYAVVGANAAALDSIKQIGNLQFVMGINVLGVPSQGVRGRN